MTERETEQPAVGVPEEDALEQRLSVDDDAADDVPTDDGAEADPADRAEQARSVPSGDDEYR
jgi:hypothetical protein